jgi:hypothetical protein
MRGRPRKTAIDSVVELTGTPYGVVLEYQNGMYRVVRTDQLGRNPMGSPIWVEATDLKPTGRTSRPPGRAYRSLLKHGGLDMLGCDCLCCGPHYEGGFQDDEG